MNRKRKVGICLIILFTGALLSLMAVMMRLGGGINFKEFLSANKVYDFSKEALKKSSEGWGYDEVQKGHRILKNRAAVKYLLDAKERGWNYLYITIEDMSVPSMTGEIRYYNREGERIAEHPMQLVEGINVITLNSEAFMYRMGILITDAKGEFLSISSMQVRTTLNWFTPEHFAKLFAVVYSVFLVVFICGIIIFRIIQKNNSQKCEMVVEKIKKGLYAPIDVLQYAFGLFGDYFGSRIGGRLDKGKKPILQLFIWCLLFIWMISGNILGWTGDVAIYRYHVLVCVLLLLVMACIAWEKPLQPVDWKEPVMLSWIFLWTGVMISDFLVKKSLGLIGFVMLFAGGFFIFVFQNVKGFSEIRSESKTWHVLGAMVVICLLYALVKYLPEFWRIIEEGEVFTIWKNYIRRWNLFGNSGAEKIFRKVTPTYSGYIYMAYRYGIFILIPYLAYQLNIMLNGVKGIYRCKSRSIFVLTIGVIHICFSICGNVEQVWGHPLWLCMYLLPCIEKSEK